MRLKKGMRKALSLALSTALIITSANIGSIKSKAAEATTKKIESAGYYVNGPITTKSGDGSESYATNIPKKMLAKIDKDWSNNGVDKISEDAIFGNEWTTEVSISKDLYKNMKKPTLVVSGKNLHITFVKNTLNTSLTFNEYGCAVMKDGMKFDGKPQKGDPEGVDKQLTSLNITTATGGTDTVKLYNQFISNDGGMWTNTVFPESYSLQIKSAGKPEDSQIDYVRIYDAAVGSFDDKGVYTSINSVTNKNETVSVDSEKEATAEVGTYTVSGSAVVVPETEIATASGIKEASLTAKDGKISVNVKAEAVKADTDVKLTGKVAGVEFPVNVKVKAAAADSSATATNGATTAPTNGATTAPTNGATTAPTSGATNTPAPVTSNTPAPTSDATPAPTEAPKGNMDKFNVAFNYVADDKWGEQSWGDKSVDVTGDGKYEISYTAQSDTADIFMMILSTDLYKGSLNKDFKLVPTTVSVGKTDYKVNAKGGWCFSDQEETNAYRYNIVNPYNGPIGSDGVTYVDPAVTSIDGLGTAPVKKGDTIKVSFTVSGMKGSTSAKSKAKVTVSKKTVTVAAGKSTTVSYKALNKAGKAVKASAKTSNKKLATVKVTSSKKIKISVPKKATKGSSAKITLTSAGKKATITVKVANPVKSAKAAKKTVKIKKGKKAKITVKVTAQNKKKATTDKLTAKSSKSKIAKITGKKVSKGKVTVTVKGAKKGTSKLTIKIGKKSVKVTVKVK